MSTLTIDFETYDPYINDYGCSGWPYPDFDLLCVGAKLNDLPVTMYNLTDSATRQHFVEMVRGFEGTIVAHNAQYEMGCCLTLGIDVYKHTWADTKILAYLEKNNRMSTALDNLGAEILGEQKENAKLAECMDNYKDRFRITVRTDKEKLAKKNMALLYRDHREVVESYCAKDVDLTYRLYTYFLGRFERTQYKVDIIFYSDLLKSLIKSRETGVRVDLLKAKQADEHLSEIIESKNKEFHKIIEDSGYLENGGDPVNYRSTAHLAKVCKYLGLKVPKSEATGTDSIRRDWMDKQEHPLFQCINTIKQAEKARKVFIGSILNLAKREENGRYGRIYPEMKIFGAQTGRVSCAGPNVQQIPARDPAMGALCRSLFVPEANQDWYCFDYSSQEPRLQVHYAKKLNAPGNAAMVDAYRNRDDFDLHSMIAELMFGSYDKEKRHLAKTINLGMSYGMGKSKLGKQLGVTDTEAGLLYNQFNKACPYLKYCRTKVEDALKARGFVFSYMKRRLYLDSGFEYKAYNAVIQGSAADQTLTAMVKLYREGIPFIFMVHDELNFSLPDERTAQIVRFIMENAVELEIPMKCSFNKGNSWFDAK